MVLSTDPRRLDVDFVHDYLAETSYWARAIPRAPLVRPMMGSECLGVYEGEQQVAFARLITDGATFAYLADVFVTESHRRRGIARWMVTALRSRSDLSAVRRWLLATRDAHPLYARAGFRPLQRPDWFMEICTPQHPYGSGQRGG